MTRRLADLVADSVTAQAPPVRTDPLQAPERSFVSLTLDDFALVARASSNRFRAENMDVVAEYAGEGLVRFYTPRDGVQHCTLLRLPASVRVEVAPTPPPTEE